jgi:hypothetical protein
VSEDNTRPTVVLFPDRLTTTVHIPQLGEVDTEFEGYPPPAAPFAGQKLTPVLMPFRGGK